MMSYRFTQRLICGISLVITVLMTAHDIVAQETAEKPFKEEEIAALLAPIALYPDQLLTQVLMAATYPFEVVQAYRWVQENEGLEGEALASAAGKQPWDESVQSLTAVPDVLEMMDEKLDWTQQLGDAFLAQQQEVMAMVQTLRGKAKEAGNLKSDEYMNVVEEPAPAAAEATAAATTTVAPSTTTIIIQPADPEVIYVPSYSPTVVYGSWWYPAYPPYYFPPPVGYYHPVGAAFAWGVAVGVRVSFWHGAYHNHCNWNNGSINIDRNINIDGDVNIGSGNNNINTGDRSRGEGASASNRSGQSASATSQGGQSWSHDPEHRKGASYRDSATAQKYNTGGSAGTRPATGGGSQSRPSTGSGPSASTRPSGGNTSSRTTAGAGSTQAAPRSSSGTPSYGGSSSSKAPSYGGSSASRSSSYGGSSTRPSTSSSASRGGAYSGMSSGSRASSYGSRGGACRGRSGGGGRRR